MIHDMDELGREIGQRPWGRFEVLLDDPALKVKRIVVKAGQRLSLQRHCHRAEHWFVTEGIALTTVDEHVVELLPGQSIDIPQGAWHRVGNPGPVDLVLVEVQTGASFAEEDIERREDDYGRPLV